MRGIDEYLKEYMATNEFRHLVDGDCNFNPPVTLSYAIERLAILHTKLYMLEDAVRNPNLSDDMIGQLKRKIDKLNGQDRPRLIAAIGEIFAKAVKEGNTLLVTEQSTKKYGDAK